MSNISIKTSSLGKLKFESSILFSAFYTTLQVILVKGVCRPHFKKLDVNVHRYFLSDLISIRLKSVFGLLFTLWLVQSFKIKNEVVPSHKI